jgi:phosphoribosylformylglycinamidine cyclo-ligase
MLALTDPDDADRAIALLEGHGVDAWVCGEVTEAGTGAGADGDRVQLSGRHPGW